MAVKKQQMILRICLGFVAKPLQPGTSPLTLRWLFRSAPWTHALVLTCSVLFMPPLWGPSGVNSPRLYRWASLRLVSTIPIGSSVPWRGWKSTWVIASSLNHQVPIAGGLWDSISIINVLFCWAIVPFDIDWTGKRDRKGLMKLNIGLYHRAAGQNLICVHTTSLPCDLQFVIIFINLALTVSAMSWVFIRMLSDDNRKRVMLSLYNLCFTSSV